MTMRLLFLVEHARAYRRRPDNVSTPKYLPITSSFVKRATVNDKRQNWPLIGRNDSRRGVLATSREVGQHSPKKKLFVLIFCAISY